MCNRFKILLTTGFVFIAMIFSLHAKDNARLLRFPDINDNLITFVYAGDIWTVNANGGEAKRLTSHKGLELFPKISPDGKWIAFSAQYSGSRQVYIMPVDGGKPRQLTYYNDVGMMPPRGGFDHITLDWTPDSKHVLFRANRTPYGKRNGKYFKISITGGMEEPLQIPEGGFGIYSPDAKKICYTPISREFRTWKRYKGGRAADLWIYNLEENLSRKITDFPGTDQIPVWYENKIYFASDRDLTLNLYSYNLESEKIQQITHHEKYDVMWPSGSNGKVVYENGGYLYKYNLKTNENKKLTIHINFDNPNIIPYYKNVKEDIHSQNISPKGNRAIFDARGDIYTVPKENGMIRNLTETQGVREIYPAWSPDGKYISYVSDETGEYEIYLLENKEDAEPKQITFNSEAWKYKPKWSPDGKYLLYSDRTLEVKLLNVESGDEQIITDAMRHEIRDSRFSPDSKWVTYSKSSKNGNDAVWVYNIETGENHKLTNDVFDDNSPVFSLNGEYIYFLSKRDFNLSFSDFEFNYVYNDATRIYALALTNESPKLFEYKSDEVKPGNNGESEAEKKKLDEVSVDIDLDNTNNRITAFPMKAGNYYNLNAVDDGILYATNDGLHMFSISIEKDQTILSGVRGAVLADDNKHILYRSGSDYGITDLSPGQKAGKGKLDLGEMEMKIHPRKEWNQIFRDGWRIFRDYFYVENIHDVDWINVREKYKELLPHVSHRADLDYLLGEMIAESNTGHCYVNYGDFERVDRVETGLLGAKLKPDREAGRFVISKIYAGENWNPDRRSPLTVQGVDVQEGDYLIGIGGEEVTTGENPYKYLENTVGKVIEITVNDQPTKEGGRTYEIKPIESELSLMYLDWVETRRKMVEEMSNGKLGYIHVPNTSVAGNRELFRGMYAYHHKQGLIIDDRYNGGGFIPDMMTELLDRETLSYWHRRGLKPSKTPAIAHDGPKAMLINHYSSSGGDAFPYYFKKKNLGKLIGTRTWGGLVGMSGNASLVDGGYIAVPRFGIFNEEGEWIIEGVGVHPDIKVFDTPHLVAKGQDPTLEKAVEVLMKQLEKNPPEKVTPPEDPDRSDWIEKDVSEKN